MDAKMLDLTAKTLQAEIDELERQKQDKIRQFQALKTTTASVRQRPDCPRGACARCWDFDGTKANYNQHKNSRLCQTCHDAVFTS